MENKTQTTPLKTPDLCVKIRYVWSLRHVHVTGYNYDNCIIQSDR